MTPLPLRKLCNFWEAKLKCQDGCAAHGITSSQRSFLSIMTAVIVSWIHEYHKIAEMAGIAAIAVTVTMLVMVDMTEIA